VARSRSEIVALVAERLESTVREEITHADVIAGLVAFSESTGTDFVKKAISGDHKLTGMVSGVTNRLIKSKAREMARSMLSNGSLSIAQLDIIL